MTATQLLLPPAAYSLYRCPSSILSCIEGLHQCRRCAAVDGGASPELVARIAYSDLPPTWKWSLPIFEQLYSTPFADHFVRTWAYHRTLDGIEIAKRIAEEMAAEYIQQSVEEFIDEDDN